MKKPLLLGLAVLLLASAQALAAPPAYRASGTFTFGGGAIAPPYPATMAANDVCLLVVETENESSITPYLSSAQGFVEVPNSGVGAGTAATNPASLLRVFWKRTVGGDTAPTVRDQGNHATGQIHCFSGVVGAGNPWDPDPASGNDGGVNDTSSSIPGNTTTVADTLIVFITTTSFNGTSTAQCNNTWAHGTLTITERTDNTNTINLGGGHCMGTAPKTSIGAYGAATVTLANTSFKGTMSIALRPPQTTIATGTDPAAQTIAPGAAVTDANYFTLQTNAATESITSMTVNLSNHLGIATLAITDDTDTVLGSVSPPVTGDNVIATAGLTATTTLTNYKVRVTPYSHTHASMPAVPGGSYSIQAPVTAWVGTGTFTHAGTDDDTAILTLDNLSPANVTGQTCTPGAVQNTISWTNPGDTDYQAALVLRDTAAVSATPTEGDVSYVVGSTIGSATVVCVVASPGNSCTDTTAVELGQAYNYKIFARDSNGNYSQNGAAVGSTCSTQLTSFNVVEVGADPATGVLKTKIAGADISAQIVARDSSNGLLTDFDKQVTLELVVGSGATACNLRTQVKPLSNHTFVAGTGRKTLDAGQFEAESHKDLRFRVTYTQGATTITSCSTDNFANRPNAFASVAASDATRTTAGNTNALNHANAPPTGPVHNAGRPFRIVATAMNGAGVPAATQNYDPDAGQPVALVSQCGTAGVCSATLGTLTTTSGDFSHAAGVITSDTASYNNVGSISVVLQDKTFANVDLADSSDAERWIQSGTVTFGRFVPDHFALSAVTLTPRSDISPGCAGSSFTYLDEPLSFAFTLTARASDGTTHTTATAYAGATLATLNAGLVSSFSFGAKSGAGTNLTSRLDTSGSTTVTGGGWVAGVAAVTAAPTMVRRATPDTPPDGPHTAVAFGIAPSDSDGVIMQAYDLDVDNAGGAERTSLGVSHELRFGRLRVLAALGSEKLSLPVTMRTEYWSGTAFVTNTADSCTTLADTNIRMDFTTLGSCATRLGNASIEFNGGIGRFPGPAALTLTAPSAAGSVLLTPQLRSTASGNYCPAGGGAADVAVGASRAYLLGRWSDSSNPDADANTMYDDNPAARASFGVYGGRPSNYIYFRENH